MAEGKAKFYCYRNLQRHNWSIRRQGRVRHHVEEAWLLGVVFQVSLAGWRRVQKQGRRNVHAYAVAAGLVLPGTDDFDRLEEQMTGLQKVEVCYDPFGGPAFFTPSPIAEIDGHGPTVKMAVAAKLTEIGLHAYGAKIKGVGG